MIDLLWYHFICDLVGGSNGLLGYKNKANGAARSALRDDYSLLKKFISRFFKIMDFSTL